MMTLRTPAALLVLALWSGSSLAQALNIDLCDLNSPAPSPAYGGVPGQAGYWTPAFRRQPVPLFGLDGSPTSAFLGYSPAGRATYDFVGGSPDELAMMNSAILFGGGSFDNWLEVGGLKPGVYDVYVYACGSPTFENLIITGGLSSTTVTIERGGWPGMQVEGRTYAKARFTLTAATNSVGVICTNATLSPIAGLQIVPVPSPGAAMVGLASAGLVGLRRRR